MNPISMRHSSKPLLKATKASQTSAWEIIQSGLFLLPVYKSASAPSKSLANKNNPSTVGLYPFDGSLRKSTTEAGISVYTVEYSDASSAPQSIASAVTRYSAVISRSPNPALDIILKKN